MILSRLDDLVQLYALLDRLEQRLDGKHSFVDRNRLISWPQRGVYFFFEPGEERSDSGNGLRVVRVGTHALTEGSRSTLRNRLSQHRGVLRTGGGNHRGSIFRLLVGTALQSHLQAGGIGSWGCKPDAAQAAHILGQTPGELRAREHELEVAVSRYIEAMPFLWVAVPDLPGPNSWRGYIERNCIALLSNWEKRPLDSPSSGWLGHRCDRERVRRSGLWNSDHVNERYDPAFLITLEECIAAMGDPARPVA